MSGTRVYHFENHRKLKLLQFDKKFFLYSKTLLLCRPSLRTFNFKNTDSWTSFWNWVLSKKSPLKLLVHAVKYYLFGFILSVKSHTSISREVSEYHEKFGSQRFGIR